jgi:recombinational DNA repair protein (RecF pathway)
MCTAAFHFDMRKSAVITCLAEICSRCITTSDPHPELFVFLHDELVQYDRAEYYDRDFMIRFLVGLILLSWIWN